MTTTTLDRTDSASMTYEQIQAFLFAEARALDDRDWQVRQAAEDLLG